jgi:transposase InsO family protein
MAWLGIQHITTTAYHPQSNGAVERFHRRLKEALKAKLAGPEWTAHLPWVLLCLRAAPCEDSGVSSAELVFGTPLNLPAAVVTAEPAAEHFGRQLSSFLPIVSPLKQAAVPSSTLSPELQAASHVYVRSPPNSAALVPAYRGPYQVVGRTAKFFTIRIATGWTPSAQTGLSRT